MKRKPSARKKQQSKTNQLTNITSFLKNISYNTKRNLFDKFAPVLVFIFTLISLSIASYSLYFANKSFKNQIYADSVNFSRDTHRRIRDSIQFQYNDSIQNAQNKTITNLLEISTSHSILLKKQTGLLEEQNKIKVLVSNSKVFFQPVLPSRRTDSIQNQGYLNISFDVKFEGARQPEYVFYINNLFKSSKNESIKATQIFGKGDFGNGQKLTAMLCTDNFTYNWAILELTIAWTEPNSNLFNKKIYFYLLSYNPNLSLTKITDPVVKARYLKQKPKKSNDKSSFINTQELTD